MDADVININSVHHVSTMQNVNIDPTNGLNKDLIINYDPEANSLIIEKNVGCRNYCNILVFINASLIIHEGVYFNNYCSINCLGDIKIGENTLFGEGVKLYDHNHKYNYEHSSLVVEKSEFSIGKITIGKNCWIGSNVTILNNVEIGDNVIIGANCLIYKSIPANSIVKHSEQLIIKQASL